MSAPFANLFDTRAALYNNSVGDYFSPQYGQDMAITGYQYTGPENLRAAFANAGLGMSSNGTPIATGEIDYSKLPGTKFGPMSNALVSINSDTKLYNPQYAYDDPNYGRITPAQNVNEPMGPSGFETAAMLLGSMGMSSLMAPAMGAFMAGAITKVPQMAFQADGMQGTGAGPRGTTSQMPTSSTSPQANKMSPILALLAMLAMGRNRNGG